MSDELKELKQITKILMLANAEILKNELKQYATTDNRKIIWVLIDGTRMSKDIARSIRDITEDAVNKFLQLLEKANLIENPPRKPPVKLLDYVPPEWLALFEKEEKEEAKEEEVKP